jgi:hypothetical protein
MSISRRCGTLVTLAALALSLPSCASISPFNPVAYEQAVSLKVDALALMTKAREPFRGHRPEVEALASRVEKAYEFARGLPDNEIATAQWALLKDPERRLLGGFLRRWEKDSTLSETFIVEAKALVADAFDTIIGLESGRIGADQVPPPGGA